MCISLKPCVTRFFFSFAIATVCGLLGCFEYPDPKEVELEAVYPLARVEFYGQDMFVYPAEGVRVEELVDMSLFRDLKPSLTFHDAEAILGDPIEKGKGKNGPFEIFQRPGGQIVVTWYEELSGEASFKAWLLSARPEKPELEEWLRPEVVRYFQGDPRQEIIFMSSLRGSPALQISIRNGVITVMTWLRSSRQIDWSSDRLFKRSPRGPSSSALVPETWRGEDRHKKVRAEVVHLFG